MKSKTNYNLERFVDKDGEYYIFVDSSTMAPYGRKIRPAIEKKISNEQYRVIQIGDEWWQGATFINNATGKPCKRMFDSCAIPMFSGGLGIVELDGQRFLYNPKNDYVFPCPIEEGSPLNNSIKEDLRNNPEDFLCLPTGCFRDTKLIHECLDVLKESVKEQYSDKNLEEVQKFTMEFYTSIQEKISKEKENIRLEDDAEARRTKEEQDKKAKKETFAEFDKALDNLKK